MIRKIYYVLPDIHKKSFSLRECYRSIKKRSLKKYLDESIFRKHKPVGGIKVIYQHALILRDLGFDVELIRMGKYVGNFFGYDISTRHYEDIKDTINKTDIVIVPEITPYLHEQFSAAIKVCFIQNWRPIYLDFRSEDKEKSYIDIGYDYVLCCSEYLANRLPREPKDKLFLVNNYIDLEKFRPGNDKRVEGSIMALPRKNPKDLENILRLSGLSERCSKIDGVTEAEMIAAYQGTDIFLATGYPEGFGLPPLEAMACGAVVVGFTGGGASEFMLDGKTALVAEDGDYEKAANLLVNIVKDTEKREYLRSNGLEIAKNYNKSATSEQLLAFYSRVSTDIK